MCPVSASDIRKLWSSPFLKGQAPAAGYHPAGPEMGSSWSVGNRMKYCLDTGWWGNSEAQMCSWRRCLEPMPFPEGVEGNTVARHPGSDCSDQLGYETSDSKPVMGNEQLVTWWRNEKGKIGGRQRRQTCFMLSGSQWSTWSLPVTELICRPGNRRYSKQDQIYILIKVCRQILIYCISKLQKKLHFCFKA